MQTEQLLLNICNEIRNQDQEIKQREKDEIRRLYKKYYGGE